MEDCFIKYVWQNYSIVPLWEKGNTVETFSRHVVFDAEGDKFRNKRIEDYITVSVVIDMEWVRRMNSIHSRVEEIVLHELAYAK